MFFSFFHERSNLQTHILLHQVIFLKNRQFYIQNYMIGAISIKNIYYNEEILFF